MPKVSLRDRLLKQRLSMTGEACLQLSLRVQDTLIAAPEFEAAASLALYSPIRNEVFTEKLFEAARACGKRVAYPRMRGTHLEFLEVEALTALSPGRMGVLEPAQGGGIPLDELELLVLPGVGFDRHGHRLGYGQGFYDRLLGHAPRRPVLAGLAYEEQVVERLPRDPHDVCIDLLVTEMHLWRMVERR